MKTITYKITVLSLFLLCVYTKGISQSRWGANDTLITGAVVFEGDTIEAKVLAGVYVFSYGNMSAKARWTRLRNAVYVTYPYAKRASLILNDINAHLAGQTNRVYISNYINSREKEFKGGFTASFWQTVAFFFGSNLKQPYDPKGEDAEIESIVKEVRRLYGYNS